VYVYTGDISSHNSHTVFVCFIWFSQQTQIIFPGCRSQWPHGLSRRSSAVRLPRLWFESHRGMDVCPECCVLSGRGLRDGFITRPEESYPLWCIVVCDLETLKTRRLKPATGLRKIQPQWVCRQLLSGTIAVLERCLQTCMTYTIAECTVNELQMMDRRTV
jgi:hypothetical protein